MSKPNPISKYERRFARGHVIFEQGEAGTRMYVIRTGLVRIYRMIDGEELGIVTLGAGEFFGEMALLEQMPRSASAKTESDCVLIEIDEATFEDMLRTNIEIAVRMLRKLSSRVRELDRKVQRLAVERGLGHALELVRDLAQGGKVPRLRLVEALVGDAGHERYEAELLVHDLLRARVLMAEGGDVIVRDLGELERFSRYLELREKYEGAQGEVSDVAGRMGRLLRALEKSEEEHTRGQTVIAKHFQEYLEMKSRFGP